MSLYDKKIAVGVCGGIAAYKSCELVRELRRSGAAVRVGMTQAAQEFVTPLTLATLSEHPVTTSLFQGNEAQGTIHLDLARWCDILVVCPATANVLAKSVTGLADDFLSTAILATEAPVVFCPAMNSAMWRKPVVQNNVLQLQEAGYHFVDPEWGKLATSAEGEGWGRLADISRIVQCIKHLVLATDAWAGKKVLVTAGPTREAIDPVRFITNHSTGKMGFALAEAAKLRGADVTLIAGPNKLDKIDGLKYIEIESVADLQKAVEQAYAGTDILLMAAAVADYHPKSPAKNKLKKGAAESVIALSKAPDILADLGQRKDQCIHVGFALETENEIENAQKKLAEKNLDLVVLNNPKEPGAAFAGDTNVVTILTRDGKTEKLPMLSKAETAERILDRVDRLMASSSAAIAV